jgi:hypothetical protein
MLHTPTSSPTYIHWLRLQAVAEVEVRGGRGLKRGARGEQPLRRARERPPAEEGNGQSSAQLAIVVRSSHTRTSSCRRSWPPPPRPTRPGTFERAPTTSTTATSWRSPLTTLAFICSTVLVATVTADGVRRQWTAVCGASCRRRRQ